ncbi:unnamed protein product [Amaranthus hypochondriacus]
MNQILHILVLLLVSVTYYSYADDPSGNYCNPNTVISSSSKISSNIDHLLADILTKFQQGATFIMSSYGTNKDTIYGLAQCRGDLSSRDCLSCIQDAAQQVRDLCPTQSDARIWYDYCFLRYSQDKFYGQVDTSIGTLYKNTQNVTNPEIFNHELGNLFDKISEQAGKASNDGLGKDEKKLSDFDTLYGLVECTRDLSPVNCRQCLGIAIQNFDDFCSNSKGCRVLYSSCYVRYELYPFFFPLDDQPPTNKGHILKKFFNHH